MITVIPLLAGVLLAFATVGMLDMAQGNHRRHGFGYAIGEYIAALLMALLAVTAFAMVLQ